MSLTSGWLLSLGFRSKGEGRGLEVAFSQLGTGGFGKGEVKLALLAISTVRAAKGQRQRSSPLSAV